MKPKQILILLLILAALAAAVIFRKSQRPAELATEVYAPLEIAFDANQVASVVISKKKDGADDKIELKKEGDAWKVVSLYNARADQEKITRLLTDTNQAKGELRAGDKSLFSDFGIADDQAIRLVFSDTSGKPLTDLLVGTKRADYQYHFVRKEGSSQVFLTEAPIFDRIGLYGEAATESLSKDFWVATNFLKFESDKVTGVEMKRFKDGTETLVTGLAKEADPSDAAKKRWKFTRPNVPFPVNADAIQSHFNQAQTSWRAQKALDPNGKDYGFTKPFWTMKLTREGADELFVTVGSEDKDANAFYVNVTGEPVVFQVSKYYIENLNVDDSKFFATNPLNIPDDKQILKLVVHADQTDRSFAPKDKTWAALTNYLGELRKLSVVKLLFAADDLSKVKSPGTNWIEIQKEGGAASEFLDVGDMLPGDTKDYAASLRNGTQAFAISEAQFKALFTDLNKLEEPKPTETVTAEATVGTNPAS